MFRTRPLPPFLVLDGPTATGTSTATPPAPAEPAAPAESTAPAAAPATPAAPTPAPVPTPPPAPQTPAPTPTPGQAPAPAAPAALTAEQIAELPEWAQREIRETRRENQGLRQTRTQAETDAAAQAEQAIAQRIGKALGIIQDDTPPDPAALVQQAEQARTEARESRIELAVFRAAPSTATAGLLLDSRAFMTKVAGLDPSKPEFDAQVAQAISDEVATNPTRFQAPAAPAAPASTGGAPITGAPTDTPDSIEAMRESYRTRQSPGA